MPRITVVIPVYNHERYVEQTLRSLFAQDYSDFQIIAVDDGSTDSSREILHRNLSCSAVIQSPHCGPAAARNRALEASDSEFVAFMDADDLCAPDRLRLSVEKLQTEDIDLVASALTFIGAAGQALPGVWTCPRNAANDYWASLLERNWIGTPSVMARRHVVDAVGAFDENFTHAEDYDLWLRIGGEYSIGYIDTSLVQCRRHDANTSIGIRSHQRFERMALQKVDRMDARKAFSRLYSTPQKRAEAWIWFLLRSGDLEFSEESSFAITQHPYSHSLRFALGVFQCDSGQYEEALVTFRALKDHDAASLQNFGVLLAFCGDIEAASSHMEAALRLRPDYYDAQCNLAAIRNGQDLHLTRRPFREHLVPMLA